MSRILGNGCLGGVQGYFVEGVVGNIGGYVWG